MVKLMFLCMHVCPYRGKFLGVQFRGYHGMKIQPTKVLYSVKLA